jgi:Putative Actinobacterial Holin-X, holin superfamily III
MFENEKSKAEDLTDQVKDYLNDRTDLAVLKISDKVSDILSTLIAGLILGLIFFFFLLFSSFALAQWLSNFLENEYLGYFIVALFYLAIGLIVYFTKEKWIKIPITNMIIKKSLQGYDEKD